MTKVEDHNSPKADVVIQIFPCPRLARRGRAAGAGGFPAGIRRRNFECFRGAEVGQTDHCHRPAAGVRRGGEGVMDGAAALRRGGHHLGAAAGGRGLLAGYFPAAAQAHVALRSGARAHACAVDVAVWRAGEKDEGQVFRRTRGHFQDEFPHCPGAVFLPALCGAGDSGVCAGTFDLELASGLFPPGSGGGLRVSRHSDGPCLADRAVRHHEPGLDVFRGGDLFGQRWRAPVGDSAAYRQSGVVEFAGVVVRKHGHDLPLVAAGDLRSPKLLAIRS